jgi:hypothetical protein
MDILHREKQGLAMRLGKEDGAAAAPVINSSPSPKYDSISKLKKIYYAVEYS